MQQQHEADRSGADRVDAVGDVLATEISAPAGMARHGAVVGRGDCAAPNRAVRGHVRTIGTAASYPDDAQQLTAELEGTGARADAVLEQGTIDNAEPASSPVPERSPRPGRGAAGDNRRERSRSGVRFPGLERQRRRGSGIGPLLRDKGLWRQLVFSRYVVNMRSRGKVGVCVCGRHAPDRRRTALTRTCRRQVRSCAAFVLCGNGNGFFGYGYGKVRPSSPIRRRQR